MSIGIRFKKYLTMTELTLDFYTVLTVDYKYSGTTHLFISFYVTVLPVYKISIIE